MFDVLFAVGVLLLPGSLNGESYGINLYLFINVEIFVPLPSYPIQRYKANSSFVSLWFFFVCLLTTICV